MVTHIEPYEFIVSAAALRLEFEDRLGLLRASTSNTAVGPIFFAADSDIVKLYTTPSEMGPPGETPNQGGYGKIFPSDDEMTSTATATVLSEFIFSKLSNYPILQLAPHADETSRILNGVVSNLGRPTLVRSRTAEWAFERELSVLVDELKQTPDDVKRLATVVMKHHESTDERAKELIGSMISLLLLGKHRLQNELVRFLSLYAKQRMISVSAFSKVLRQDATTTNLATFFSEPRSLGDFFDIGQETNYWMPRLIAAKSSLRGEQRVRRDAQALAHLSYFNRKLADIGGRIVLISGDRALKKVVSDAGESARSLKVLHPRAFLIEAVEQVNGVFDTSKKRPFRTGLEVLLMEYSPTSDGGLGRLEEIVDRSPKLTEELKRGINRFSGPGLSSAFLDFAEEWEQFKTHIVASRMLAVDSSQHLVRSLLKNDSRQSGIEVELAIQELQKQLEEQAEKQWDELSLSFSTAGVGLLYAIGDGDKDLTRRPRNPPTVMLDSFSCTQTLVSKVLATKDISKLTPSFDSLIADIAKDVSRAGMDSRHKNYLTFLAFSVLSAAEAKWYVARVLAERAVEQGERIYRTNPDDPITGREAYFVLSQAKRITARGLSDLNKSKEFLNVSKDRFAIELERAGGRATGELTELKALRFSGEEIALEIATLHFVHWQGTGGLAPSQLLSLVDSIAGIVESLSGITTSAPHKAFFVQLLGSYLFVNAMQLYHIAHRLEIDLGDSFSTILLALWQRYGSRMEDVREPQFHESYLMSAYRHLYEAKLLEPPRNHRRWEGLSEYSIDKNSVTGYDRTRFIDLAKFIVS